MMKPSNYYNIILWVGSFLLSSTLFLFDYNQIDGLFLKKSMVVIGRDFLNVWSGGNIALSGNLDRLYDYDMYRSYIAEIFGPLAPYNYSYPPHSLFIAVFFAELPYATSLLLWTILGIIFFIWAARPFMPSNLLPIFAILTPAALVNIWAGHYGFVIGGLWFLFFSTMEHHPKRSGIYAGLLTLKPHLGLLIAFTLAYRKMGTSIAIAIATTLLLVGASGVIFGFDLWRSWIVDTSALQARIMTDPNPNFYYRMMVSPYIAFRGMTDPMRLCIHLLIAVSALSVFWKARNAHPHDLAFISSSTTALILPYIFNYDLTVACLGFAVFLYKRWPISKSYERIALWLAFMAPLVVMFVDFVAPFCLLAGLCAQVNQIIREEQTKQAILA